MNPSDDGGPAYPVHIPAGGGCGPGTNEGMSLRDHFAGLAMQGICASAPGIDNFTIAAEAYRIADAMLAARSA